MPRTRTAPIAAAGLVAGYATASLSGSRPLGGLVLLAFGAACASTWRRRDGTRMMLALLGVGVAAFALSHVLALLVGAWPAVLLAAAATFIIVDRKSDAGRVSLAQPAPSR